MFKKREPKREPIDLDRYVPEIWLPKTDADRAMAEPGITTLRTGRGGFFGWQTFRCYGGDGAASHYHWTIIPPSHRWHYCVVEYGPSPESNSRAKAVVPLFRLPDVAAAQPPYRIWSIEYVSRDAGGWPERVIYNMDENLGYAEAVQKILEQTRTSGPAVQRPATHPAPKK